MTRPVILVEGFGRCGTTMMMRMLDVGGIPCIGSHPGYEDDRAIIDDRPARDAFYRTLSGVAIKALDPHRWALPADLNAVVIWLDRDPIQQAKSAVKLMSYMMPGMVRMDRAAVRKLAKSYGIDRPRARRAGLVDTKPSLIVRFEHVLRDPKWVARLAGNFLQDWFPNFDAAAAAGVVHRRSPECLDRPMELDYAQ